MKNQKYKKVQILWPVVMVTNIYVDHSNMHYKSRFLKKDKACHIYLWFYLDISLKG